MCGISGLVQNSTSFQIKANLQKMIQLIRHRGPDGEGYFVKNGFGIANCRLAIIDPNQRSDQPLNYQDYSITFNGAIYNYTELKEELQSLGYQFFTESDTEVILVSYIQWGTTCVQRFNGMWAFSIYDPKKNILFCSRDRYGIKPFYYRKQDKRFAFASEIKAFTVLDWNHEYNANTFKNYLQYGLQDYNHDTLFKNVWQLKAGHNLTYDLRENSFSISKYYKLNTEINPISFKEARDTFRYLFDSSVKLRLRADRSIGSCLSGGLDSSSIVSQIATKKYVSGIQTVSAVYSGTSFDESKYVQSIIEKYNIRNCAISPTLDELLDALPALVWQQDEAFSSASVFAQNEVFKKAKELDLRVMLDGQGGDEIVAGYDIFMYQLILKKIKNKEKGSFKLLVKWLRNKNLSDKFKSFVNYSKKSKNSKLNWMLLADSDKIPLNTESSISGISKYLLENMGLQVLLHYEDRNSMAHGVESRLPFLDYRLVEFCLSLPEKFKIHGTKQKYILRESMKNVLPDKIYKRKTKLGFEVPQKLWFAKNKQEIRVKIEKFYAQSSIIDVSKLPKRMDSGQLWRLLLGSIWLQVFKLDH